MPALTRSPHREKHLPVNTPPPPPPSRAAPPPRPASVPPPAASIPSAPAPVTAPPPSFRVPVLGWILWGIYVIAVAVIVPRVEDSLSPYQIGRLIGSATALLLLPTALSWVGWRICGRSRVAANIVWVAVFLLALGGQVAQGLHGKRTAAERTAPEQEIAPGARAAEPIEVKPEPAAELPATSEQRVEKAMQAYVQRMNAARLAFDRASEAVAAPRLWDLSQCATADDIAKCRALVLALEETLAPMEELIDENGSSFGRELARFGVAPPVIEQTIRGFRASDGERTKGFIKLNELNRQLVAHMKAHLDFAEANLGKWRRVGGNSLQFDDSAAATAFTQRMTQVLALQQQQAELQQQTAGR